MNTRIHTVLVAILLSSVIHAQTEVGYQRGSSQAEDILPPSPEAASVVKYAGVPFTHSLGTAEYEVPLYTLKGRQLEIPLSLRYRSNGIKVDEIAGVAGLGWSLEAGGCVTREVVYMPDEFNNWNFYTMPSGSLLSDLVNMTWSNQAQLFIDHTLRNRHDANADRYSYSVAGLSGTFIVTPNREIIQLSGDGVIINAIQSQGYNGPITSFQITGPDGTLYFFAETETSTRKDQRILEATIETGQQVDWDAITTWHLSRIESADRREYASFGYSDGGKWTHDATSRTQGETIICDFNGVAADDSSFVYSVHNSLTKSECQTRVLTSIELCGSVVSFEYSMAGGTNLHKPDTRLRLNNHPRRLTSMTVTSSIGTTLANYTFDTAHEAKDGRIILRGVNRYFGTDLTDQWSFSYKTLDYNIWRYSQDWFGYYNNENNDGLEVVNPWPGGEVGDGPGGTTTEPGPVAPTGPDTGTGSNTSNPRPRNNFSPYSIDKSTTPSPIRLSFGFPTEGDADYMSLKEAVHNGTKTCFEYEGAYVRTIDNKNINIGIRVKRIKVYDVDTIVQCRSFEYSNPACTGLSYPSYEDYVTLKADEYLSGSNQIPQRRITWNYSVHESSTSVGAGLGASRATYGKVTETVHASETDTLGVKTVYYYDTDVATMGATLVSQRIPSFVSDLFNEANNITFGLNPSQSFKNSYCFNDASQPPLLIKKESYILTPDSDYQLLEEETYSYGSFGQDWVMVGYAAQKLLTPCWTPLPIVSENRILHYPIYTSRRLGYTPSKVTRVGYHSSGNDTTIVNYSYVSRPTLDKPIRQAMVRVDGSDAKRVVTYEYPDTTSLSGAWINQLTLNHRLNEPIRQNYIRIVDQDTTSTMTREVEYGQFSGHLQLKKVQEFTDGAESWREEVFTRDNYGNVTSLKERGKPKMSVTWTNDGMYPASITNGEGSIAQTSTYTWIPGIGLAGETTPQGIITSYEYDSAGRLARIKDTDGNTVEEYTYNLLGDVFGRKNIRKKTFLSGANTQYRTDVSWYNSLGMKTQETAIDATPDGRSLVSSFEGDYLLHDDVKSWLPFPTDALSGLYISNAQAASTTYHQSDEAYHYKGYEESSREKVESTSLPGYFAHKNKFSDDVRADYPRYVWVDGAGVTQNGVYPSSEVLTEVSTDADGKVKTTITDRFGNILGTEYGSGTGRTTSSTRVYDNKGRLRAVIGGGIAITDTLNMWRYSYDALGRVSSKGIPGSIRESYSYDNEDRVISMTKGNEYTEYVYDAQGRLTHRYLTVGNGNQELMEKHEYDTRSQDSAMFLVIVSQSLSGTVQNCGLAGLETLSKFAIIDENGAVDGYATTSYAYDKLGRQYRKVTMRTGHNSGFLSEECRYDFRGNVTKSAIKNGDNIGGWDILQTNNQYDARDRLTRTVSSLMARGGQMPVIDTTVYTYDALGRLWKTASSSGGPEVQTENAYTLQNFLQSRTSSIDGNTAYRENLYYDNIHPLVTAGIITQPNPLLPVSGSHTGQIRGKQEKWGSGNSHSMYEGYRYNNAGRLSWVGWKEVSPLLPGPNVDDSILYEETATYDATGNPTHITFKSDGETSSENEFSHSGHMLATMTTTFPDLRPRPGLNRIYSFTYDNRGRMTYDGQNKLSIEYNHLDLPSKVSKNGIILAKYSYLADGTKIGAMASDSTGYVYTGPLVYRRDSTGVLSFESAAIAAGRITAGGVHYYMTDHLGSVKTVVSGSDGLLLEDSKYDVWGKRSDGPLPTLPVTSDSFRYHFTGKEDQSPAFGISYTDFGARHYSPNLRRWLVPDPLSEQYYDVSPYAYCAGDPVNQVDYDGKESIKKVDENGNKVIESNVIVLLEKTIPLDDSMSEKAKKRITKKNRKIENRNQRRLNKVKSDLDKVYSGAKNSKGEKVIFHFNVIGKTTDKADLNSLGSAIDIAIKHGLPAKTHARVGRGSNIALAAVISSFTPAELGVTKGKVLIQVRDDSPSTLGHEVGHTLGLTHPKMGADYGLMHYPPENLAPEEVDTIWENAYEEY